jgi:hypothetical protein
MTQRTIVDIWEGSYPAFLSENFKAAYLHIYMLYERMNSGVLRLYVGETAHGTRRVHQSLKRFSTDSSTRVVLLLFSDELQRKNWRTYVEGRLYFAFRRNPEICLINNHRMISVSQHGLDPDFLMVAEKAINLGTRHFVNAGVMIPSPAVHSTSVDELGFEIAVRHQNQIVYADAYIDRGVWVVRKDSIARHLDEGPSDDGRHAREKLIAEGFLAPLSPGLYRFVHDIAFSHPNISASIINGKSACGLSRWLVSGYGVPLRDTGLKLPWKKGSGSTYTPWSKSTPHCKGDDLPS